MKGAFTNADKIALAASDTPMAARCSSNEIGDMPISIQVKLLRMLKAARSSVWATNEPVKGNVRLISATNRDLGEAITKENSVRTSITGSRWSVSKLAALRERRARTSALDRAFPQRVHRVARRNDHNRHAAVRKAIMAYSWPGNVREPEDHRACVVLDSDGQLDLDDMTEDLQAFTSSGKGDGSSGLDSLVGQSLEEIENTTSSRPSNDVTSNREEASRQLGIGERTLYRKLKEYNLG